MQRFFRWLDRNRDTGNFLLRLFVGFRLLEGVADNIFSWHRMVEFSEFLNKFGFPFPVPLLLLFIFIFFLFQGAGSITLATSPKKKIA